MKTTLDGINNRLETAGKNISANLKTEEQKFSKMKYKEKRYFKKEQSTK